VGSEFLEPTSVASNVNEQLDIGGTMTGGAGGIDWDITLDSSQIDWDIGTVEEADDAANGLGPYEIVNASDILLETSTNDNEKSSEAGLSGEVADMGISEISWDVSVENPQMDIIEDSGLPGSVETQLSAPNASVEAQQISGGRSPLLETEYRNKILDDLFEVCVADAMYRICCLTILFVIIFSNRRNEEDG